MTAATGAVPSTAGEMESNVAWRRLGVMWTPVENQSMVELVAPHGSIGPVKYLVFEFDSAGDGQSNIIREIDVRGGPAFSQPDLRIEKVNGSTVRLNWRAEYENWYLEQQVNDPRYGWTPAFLGSNLPVVQNYRTSRDYNIPAAGMQPNTQKRSLFRMFRVDPVEAP